MKSKVLVVAAHCDDELLGAGCYIDKLIREGHEVSVCCMTFYTPTREEDIHEKMLKIHKKIGVKKTYVAPFVALSSRGSSHIEKVQFVENAILDSQCDVVITHNKYDLHKDHIEVYETTMEAIRLYQRRPDMYDKNKIKKVMCMEIPCASLWADTAFHPTMFVKTNEEDVKNKVNRVGMYDDVIRDCPHPRSMKNVIALSRVRGAQCGCEFAEAFEVVFELEN